MARAAKRGGMALAAAALVTTGLLAVSPPPAQAEVVPVAYDDSYAGDRDTPFSVGAPGALGNDFGVGPGYRARLVSDADLWPGATLDFYPDGSFDYDPNSPALAGENSFTYCIGRTTSSECVSNVATVYLYIDEPFVIPHSYGIAADDVLNVAAPGLLVGSRNPQSDDELYQLSSPQGIVDFHSDGSFTYTPPPGFTGTDSFRYCWSDEQTWPRCSGNSAPATISVFPTPQDQSVSTVEGTPYAGRLYPPANGPITFSGLVTGAPDHGDVSIGNDGSFTYTPGNGYAGPDSFDFCLTADNSSCLPGDRATVSITVTSSDVTTATTLTGPATPSYGQPISLTATIAPPIAGGTVAFREAGTTVAGCAAVPVTASTATCTPTDVIEAGGHTFTAEYSGAGGVLGSTSAPMTLTVIAAPTNLDYTGSTSGLVATPIVVSARLANAASGATGPAVGESVSFEMADGLSCSGITDAAGDASCSLTPNRSGPLTLSVVFSGSARHQAKTVDLAVQISTTPGGIGPTAPGGAGPAVSVPPTGGGLPATGAADLGGWIGAATLLIGAGAFLVLSGRLRRRNVAPW